MDLKNNMLGNVRIMLGDLQGLVKEPHCVVGYLGKFFLVLLIL